MILCILISVIASGIEKDRIARDPVKATIEADFRATEKARPTSTNVPTSTKVYTAIPTEIPTEVTELSLLMHATGLKEDVANHVLNVIHFSGFEKITSVEKSKGFSENEFELNSNLGLFLAEIKPLGIYKFSWNSISLYDIENSIGYSATSYILTEDDELMYQAWVIANVKHNLVSPSTARFKYDWKYGIKDQIVTVQSAVDSQNAFAALIKNTFTAQFNHSTTDVLYFEISGHVIYGAPQQP